MYTGWQLSNKERQELLQRFPPKYEKVVAHHITHSLGEDKPLPPIAVKVFVVGYIAINGVEVLIIMLNGSTYRSIGGLYHITWSLEKNRKPKDSNAVLSRYGYKIIDPIELFELKVRKFK